jgi:hypothetical protein
VGEKLIKFNSSSSCLIPSRTTNGYSFNIRLVNYRIDEGGYYHDYEDHIITSNKYMELNKDLEVVDETYLDVEYEPKKYLGVEDVRIYSKDDGSGDLVFIGCSQHMNGNIGILVGDYKTDGNGIKGLAPTEISPSFCESSCEKNWVYFTTQEGDNRIVYKWSPLQICKINKATHQLDVVETRETLPRIFSHSRGSTYKDEIWFILHIVSYEQPRHYYHFFAVFDKHMNFLRHSAPFKFEGICIEYCLGLVVEEERVLVSYSTMDRTTTVAVYSKSYIDELVKY